MNHRSFQWLAVLCACALLGCGGSSSDKPSTKDATPAADGGNETDTAPKRVAKEQLVAVTYGFRPLDNGRIEAGAPVGWGPGPIRQDYVIWFTQTSRSVIIPQIIVLAKDAAPGETLTEDKVEAFASTIEKRLADEGTTLGKGLVEPVRPMIIGDRPCARYVTRRKIALGPTEVPSVEIQVLVTVLNGREYTVELRVRDEDNPPDGMQDELRAERDAAYSVLAGLKPAGTSTEAPKDPS